MVFRENKNNDAMLHQILCKLLWIINILFFFTWYQFIIYIYIVAVQKIPELKDELKSVKDELKAVKDELKLAKDELKAELKAEVFMKSSSIGIYWF